MNPAAVVTFWREAGPGRWFKKDPAFDAKLRARFEAAHHAGARGELGAWEQTAEGALALVLLLDQIPRNIYRNSAHAFAADGLAAGAAQRALAAGFDARIEAPLTMFFYLPLEHAENLALQDECVRRFEAMGEENYTQYARLHRDIIARFGRFPHRNALLGRLTTTAEQAFLDAGGFAG